MIKLGCEEGDVENVARCGAIVLTEIGARAL